MNEQIILIGLDGCEPTLIEQWVKEGHLPTLASLMKKGIWRRLLSDGAISSGSTWTSVFTGASPARHGAGFTHRQIKPGTYKIRKFYAEEFLRDPFWHELSRRGKRIAIFDFPKTYPFKDIRGLHITGWGTESHNHEPSSSPAELLGEIHQRFRRHPLHDWYHERPKSVSAWLYLAQQMIEGAQTRVEVAKWLFQKERWDVFAVCFAELHWSGHFFWHLMDPNHPEHDPKTAASTQNLLLEVYQEVDRSLETLASLAPDAIFLITSNVGMGPNYSGIHLVPEILDRLGLGLQKATANIKRVTFLPYQKWGNYAFKKVESILSIRVVRSAKRLFPYRLWNALTRRFLDLGNDWKDRRVFPLPNDFAGALRINLKGREPNGLVEPGEEYDHLCDEIIREFQVLEIPETGEKAVQDVFVVRERYPGENADYLPDIIVMWHGDSPIRSLRSPRIGTVSGEFLDERTGAHRPYGFLLAVGPNIKSGETLMDGNIMDIVPTILHLLGESSSVELDGKVLTDIFLNTAHSPSTFLKKALFLSDQTSN